MYFKNEKSLTGKTYKDALFLYNDSAILGVKNSSGEVKINPPMDTVLNDKDEILAITEDDDTIILSGLSEFKITKDAIVNSTPVSSVRTERNVILGWNKRGKIIIRELDEYVESGSEIHIIADVKKKDVVQEELSSILKNQTVKFIKGDISKSTVLEENEILAYDNIIILNSYDIDPQEADAVTLISLLHIRNMSDKAGISVNIVSEMFDETNRQLAEVTKADDFIISEDLISRLLSQLSETADLKKVFDDLFDADGSEIYLKDAKEYIKPGEKVNFYTVIEAAANKSETAIGFRIIEQSHSHDNNYGIVINPVKTEEFILAEGDKIIVLAEY